MGRSKRKKTGDPVQGDKIRLARQAAGLTQSVLGERIGAAQNTVSEFETGDVACPRKTLKRIATATNEPLSYFEEESDMPGEINDFERQMRTKIRGKLARRLKGASPELIDQFTSDVAALLDSRLPKQPSGKPPKPASSK